jgi:PAS domain S-box-containing protein
MAADALDPSTLFSQYSHSRWTLEEQLPSNAVHAVLQTPDGYLWLGTEGGLVRFDGLRFTVYDRSNTPAIRHNDVYDLAVTRDGSLWAATNGGGAVRLKDGVFSRIGAAEGLPSDQALSLLEEEDGTLWIGTAGPGICRLRNGRVERLDETACGIAGNVVGLAPRARGGFWLVQSDQVGRMERGRYRNLPLPRDAGGVRPTCVRETRDGCLWIGTDEGLLCWDGRRFESVGREPGSRAPYVYDLLEDSDGCLWAGTYGGGLLRLRPGGVKVFGTGDGLSDERILSLFEDASGTLWTGTRGGGLDCWRDGLCTTTGSREGLQGDMVYAVCEDRQGRIWTGTVDGGLSRLGPTGPERVPLPGFGHGDLQGVTSLFCDEDGAVWVGTDHGEVLRMEGDRVTDRMAFRAPARLKVSALFRDRRGRLWAGSRGGWAAYVEGGSLRVLDGDAGLPNPHVHAFFEDREGRLWATTSAGPVRWEQGRFLAPFGRALAEDRIFSACTLRSGLIVFASYSRGLLLARGGRLARLSTAEGLRENALYNVLSDGSGRLWMGGNRGISSVSEKDVEAFFEGRALHVPCRAFGILDGMRHPECNGGGQSSAILARNGSLWFATTRGVVRAEPGRLLVGEPPPGTRVEQVLVNSTPADPKASGRLPLGRGRIEVLFSAPRFSSPESLRFSYRLLGFDAAWTPPVAERKATYTNLPPGTLTFEVAAVDEEGRRGRPSAFTLTLLPPFHRTWGFRVLILAAFVLLVAGLIYAGRRRADRRSRALEARVRERTQEIREQKERLEELEERFRALAHSASDAILCCDAKGSVFFWNPAAERAFGLSARRRSSPAVHEFFAGEARGVLERALADPAWQADGEGGLLDVTARRLSGGEFPAEASLARWTHRGEPCLTLVVRDMTERRRLERRLQRVQKMEAIAQLAGGVAHDFNNLLQAMLTATEALERPGQGSRRLAEVGRELREDIRRGANLTRQLLLFSRQDAFRPSAEDLGDLVRRSEGLLRRLLPPGIQLDLRLSAAPLPVRADPAQVEQVLVNLAMNASDAMGASGPLTLSTGESETGGVFLSVADRGPGVSEAIRERIFEPFFTTKTTDQGSGLGLAVVQGVVEQHRGTIAVEGRPGGGALFLLRLPRRTDEEPGPAPTPPDVRPEGPFDLRRVLLVEDAPGVRAWLEEALDDLGYLVESAGSARQALSLPADRAFDLLLTDVQLPDIDGTELSRLAKERWPSLGVVLMSGFARDLLLERDALEGQARFLQKPFTLDALARELDGALAERGGDRALRPGA